MKTKLKKTILLVAGIIFLLSSTLYAQRDYDKREGKERCSVNVEGKFEKLTEELGLTAEQEAKLKEERKEFMKKNKDLMRRMRSKREELKQELEKPNIDRAKVGTIINDLKNLTGEKLESRIDKIISMKSTLTPEQFEKLQAKMKQKQHAHPGGNKYKRRFGRW